MKLVKGMKGFVIGFATCAMLSASVAYASTGTQIEVFFSNLKYMFDGVQKTPTTSQGLIYNGTTYVPLRFVGESLGKQVTWDGVNQTVWIGQKTGEFKYLDEVEYAREDGKAQDNLTFDKTASNGYNNYKASPITIASTRYEKGFSLLLGSYSDSNLSGSIDYNLNGQYKTLTGFAGIDDAYKNSKSFGTLKIIGDGKELYSVSNMKGGDLPKSLNVDITGVLKLQIQFINDKDSYDNIIIDFADAKIIE